MTNTTDNTWALLVLGDSTHLGRFGPGGGISFPLCGAGAGANVQGIVPASTARCAECKRIAGDLMRPDMDVLGETIQRLEFDTVFEVKVSDGTVIERHDLYAPTVTNDPDGDVDVDGEGWECLTGMTGQYGYNGAGMHASEYIGTGIAERLYDMAVTAAEDGERLAFVAVVIDDADDGEPDGWAIAYRKVPVTA